MQAIFDRSPFIGWLGLKVVALDHERQEITVSDGRCAPSSSGAPAPVSSTAGRSRRSSTSSGDFAIGMLVGGGVPTINLRTDYLRPAIGEALTAVARVRRAGKTAAIVDIEVVDDEQRLVALGRGTYSSSVG